MPADCQLLNLEETDCSLETFNCGKRSINKFIRKGLRGERWRTQWVQVVAMPRRY